MTFDDWWDQVNPVEAIDDEALARAAWDAGRAAQREADARSLEDGAMLAEAVAGVLGDDERADAADKADLARTFAAAIRAGDPE